MIDTLYGNGIIYHICIAVDLNRLENNCILHIHYSKKKLDFEESQSKNVVLPV